MKKLRNISLYMLLIILSSSVLSASNLVISNVRMMNKQAQTMQVCFDISWEYSWRATAAPGNWDAAWVFFKYRVQDQQNNTWSSWSHVNLNNTGHMAPTGSTITTGLRNPAGTYNVATNPGEGIFIYRDAVGSGNVAWNNVCAVWNYAQNGVGATEVVEVRAFAIEMVYVPTATYQLGDGTAESGATGYYSTTVNAANVFPSTACCGNGSNNELSKVTGGGSTPISTLYPNGYNGFYMMKDLLTQCGYKDFLNTLTRAQQDIHHPGRAVGDFMATASGQTTPLNRNGIKITVDDGTNPRVYQNDLNTANPPNSADDGQHIACNFINYVNLYSYLDWAGLRPMTNMEFEKAARGPVNRVASEYPWGNTSYTRTLTITNPGTAEEVSGTAGANVIIDQMATGTGPQGPMRVGGFATATSTRIEAGAGYYGVLNMAGNLHDFCINLTQEGRVYTGAHGDGTLNTQGFHNESTWPDQGVTSMPGGSSTAVSVKGSCWMHGPTGAQVSRHLADDLGGGTSIQVTSFYGGRGVRTAP